MAKKKTIKKTKATKKTSKKETKKTVKKVAKKAVKKAVAKKKSAKKMAVAKKVAKKAPAKVVKKKVAKKSSQMPQKVETSKNIEKEKAEKVKKLANKAQKAQKTKELVSRISLNKLVIPPFMTSKEHVLAEAKKDKLIAKWYKLYRKAEKLELAEYNMKHKYEEKTAISHKTMGWGYIVSNVHDRLEVLFEGGVKFLISNYK